MKGDSCFIYPNGFAELPIIKHAWHMPESITLKFQAPSGASLCVAQVRWTGVVVCPREEGSLEFLRNPRSGVPAKDV